MQLHRAAVQLDNGVVLQQNSMCRSQSRTFPKPQIQPRGQGLESPAVDNQSLHTSTSTHSFSNSEGTKRRSSRHGSDRKWGTYIVAPAVLTVTPPCHYAPAWPSEGICHELNCSSELYHCVCGVYRWVPLESHRKGARAVSNVRLIPKNRKSEWGILMSWQVVHIDDKFHTQADTFSNVNVLPRNKMHSNDGNNGSEGECFA